MELIYHTSPEEITKITKRGKFADCLFFSNDIYAMGKVKYIYALDGDKNNFIETWRLFDEDLIKDIANFCEVDLEVAEGLLQDRKNIYNETNNEDWEMIAEMCWYIQQLQGECAKKMGFDGAMGDDEQGTVYIIPMFNRENDLILVEKL